MYEIFPFTCKKTGQGVQFQAPSQTTGKWLIGSSLESIHSVILHWCEPNEPDAQQSYWEVFLITTGQDVE